MALFLRTHGPDECSGPFCVIHNPSDHPLADAPMRWRSDKHVMERICPHGIGHDDPDDATTARMWLSARIGNEYTYAHQDIADALTDYCRTNNLGTGISEASVRRWRKAQR